MSGPEARAGAPLRSWRAVHAEVLRRIHAREWRPGESIPNEAELAAEFGCARATVNRALRAAAEEGLLERRRRAGTRVARHPVGRARLEIPVIRLEIEGRGLRHDFTLLARERRAPPAAVRETMALPRGADALRLRALHRADAKPFVLEERWISLAAVPEAAQVDFAAVSPNEWLVAHAPYTRADVLLGAVEAGPEEAAALGAAAGAALFLIERVTWDGPAAITAARLSYAPGYRMRAGA